MSDNQEAGLDPLPPLALHREDSAFWASMLEEPLYHLQRHAAEKEEGESEEETQLAQPHRWSDLPDNFELPSNIPPLYASEIIRPHRSRASNAAGGAAVGGSPVGRTGADVSAPDSEQALQTVNDPKAVLPTMAYCSTCQEKTLDIVRFIEQPWRLPLCRPCAVKFANTHKRPSAAPIAVATQRRRRRRRRQVAPPASAPNSPETVGEADHP